jgi:hypothetical protein
MFITIQQRKLKYDIALDLLLLESYRDDNTNKVKHRFLKQWTTRKSELCTADRRTWFLEDIEYDLMSLVPFSAERSQILSSAKKKLQQLTRK